MWEEEPAGALHRAAAGARVLRMKQQYCRLGKMKWLRAEGEDSESFLQSQFSNDLIKGPAEGAVFGLFLDHRGRALGSAYVWRNQTGGFEIYSTDGSTETIRQSLDRHIIADDVVLSEHGEGMEGFVMLDRREDETSWPVPRPPDGCVYSTDTGWIVSTRRYSGRAYDVAVAAAEAGPWASRLQDHGWEELSPAELESLRIEAGLPSVPLDVAPSGLGPVEAGLLEAAVSLEKGCFLGQEVVNRMARLDRARERLVRVQWSGSAVLASEDIWTDAADQPVGRMASRAAGGEGEGSQGLAVIKGKYLESTTDLWVRAEDGKRYNLVVKVPLR